MARSYFEIQNGVFKQTALNIQKLFYLYGNSNYSKARVRANGTRN